FEAHEVGLSQRQLFEHLTGDSRIRDVQYEYDAPALLLRVPLIDLAIQVEVHGVTNLVWQDRKHFGRVDTGIDRSDRENFCDWGRCRHGLCASWVWAKEAEDQHQAGGKDVFHLSSPSQTCQWERIAGWGVIGDSRGTSSDAARQSLPHLFSHSGNGP